MKTKPERLDESSKPSVTPDVVARFAAYHAVHPEIFHIVLDDDNIEHGHAKYCQSVAKGVEGAELGRMLVAMSSTQRLKLARKYRQLVA